MTPGLPGLRIGLTGGIGSGKSTVAALLVARGAALVDTDAIARALTAAGGAAMPAVLKAFSAEVADASGALDRGRMRALVFADPGAKLRLEALLHPLIGAEARAQADAAAGRPIVFDVPLLAESAHWRERVQRILVVDCSAATQLQRVMARSGWSEDAVLRVIAQQAPRALRRSVADAVICNDGIDLQTLETQVDAVWTLWNNSRS